MHPGVVVQFVNPELHDALPAETLLHRMAVEERLEGYGDDLGGDDLLAVSSDDGVDGADGIADDP